MREPAETLLGEEEPEPNEGGQRYQLLVFSRQTLSTHPLPESGRVVIGRGEQAEVRVEARTISRRHALLSLGPPLTLEDLGSANGTRVRGALLQPGKPVPLGLGEMIELGSVTAVVQRAGARERRSSTGSRVEPALPPVVSDPRMAQLYQQVERIGKSEISVILMGETGVGKELFAEAIHRASSRSGHPFLRLNCAALSESLFESELFGHEKGSFTGAIKSKPGLLESAEGGTVLLDEVGELPLSGQMKLLRVIERREVLRVGEVKTRPIDIRLISATHRDLEGEVKKGSFRQDLFFRLNGVALLIPPLRERVGEIEPLARAFIAQSAQRMDRKVPALSPEALAVLQAYPWPGNIRELRNVIERAVLFSGQELGPEALPLEKLGGPRPGPWHGPEPSRPASRAAGPAYEVERRRILSALEQSGGNQTVAAKLLGISRRTMLTRMDEYRIPRPRKAKG